MFRSGGTAEGIEWTWQCCSGRVATTHLSVQQCGLRLAGLRVIATLMTHHVVPWTSDAIASLRCMGHTHDSLSMYSISFEQRGHP